MGLTQQITQNNLLDRCDELEDAARLSAIERAKFLVFGAHEVVAPQLDARVTITLEYEVR